jgi:hypothetical protein
VPSEIFYFCFLFHLLAWFGPHPLSLRFSEPPDQQAEHRQGRQVEDKTAGVMQKAVGNEFPVHIDGQEAQGQYPYPVLENGEGNHGDDQDKLSPARIKE